MEGVDEEERLVEKHNLPVYVAWWVAADHPIEWREGNARLEHLHQNGPTGFAFNFSRPFDPDGNACALDREAVRVKAAMNARVQGPLAIVTTAVEIRAEKDRKAVGSPSSVDRSL